jgi:alkyl hydroperoxide reductase subunit AhpF
MLDLVIIGGSAAGCSAAIYAARRKLNFKMIAENMGGEVALSGEVANWPGIQSIHGFELANNFTEHVRSYRVDIMEGWRVEKINSEKNFHIIMVKNIDGEIQNIEAKTIIIATGIHPRKLLLPGMEEFDHKGITYCTVCDGPLFRGKITATLGSGNSALESAIMMAGIAKKVYLVSLFENNEAEAWGFPNGEKILADKIKAFKNVEVLYKANTTEIFGEETVKGLRYKNKDGETKEIAVDAVMVHVGTIPNSTFVDSVKKDKLGQIIIDKKCETNIPGIFAAGDVTDIPYKQIGIASGQGILAALSAIDYVNKWKE